MKYIGIDPGAKGAFGVVEKSDHRAYDMPVHKTGVLKDKVNTNDVYRLLYQITGGEPCVIVLEKQGVQNVTSKKSGFSMGMNYYGLLYGVQRFVDDYKASFVIITPQQWKKTLGLLGKKGMSQEEKKQITESFVQNTFPGAKIRGPKGGLLDGRSDALAIAEYARRKY